MASTQMIKLSSEIEQMPFYLKSEITVCQTENSKIHLLFNFWFASKSKSFMLKLGTSVQPELTRSNKK